jgi:hypothetical protein
MRLTLRRMVIVLPLLPTAVPQTRGADAEPDKRADYKSPYAVKFTFSPKELTGDFENGLRSDAKEESSVPFAEWYSPKVRDKYGVWGPPARVYPAPEGLERRSAEWKQQRVIAAALRFQGYGYQHHHVPDWSPPADWPWKETKGGHNGKGVDCSNFTAFTYNLGLGVKFTGDVKKQAELKEAPGPGADKTSRFEKVEKPKSYAELVKALHTGDLLFIRNKSGDISHVVLWVGAIGEAPDMMPLVLDSHGDGVKDSAGAAIPHGIYLRPFRENSWYYQSASHALRIIREN